MRKITFIVSILFFANFVAKAQGCSDAGFCTINSFKPHASDSLSTLKNQFKFGISLGSSDYNISVITNYIEYNAQLNKYLGLDLKLATLAQSGNGILKFGLSDIYVNLNHSVNKNLKVILGAKIPLNNGNASENNKALPMDYQASLGTLDLIAGLAFNLNKLQVVAAWQQPLTQNKNTFLAQNYGSTSVLGQIQSTNGFERSGDILLRLSYPISLNKKILLNPSLLPIYHLSNDKFLTALKQKQEIIGSKGLTLNGNLYLNYQLNQKNAFQISLGAPFKVRNTRPDGLTRSFVFGLEYKIKF